MPLRKKTKKQKKEARKKELIPRVKNMREMGRAHFAKRLSQYMRMGEVIRVVRYGFGNTSPNKEIKEVYGYFVPPGFMKYECENCGDPHVNCKKFKRKGKWYSIKLCDQCEDRLL